MARRQVYLLLILNGIHFCAKFFAAIYDIKRNYLEHTQPVTVLQHLPSTRKPTCRHSVAFFLLIFSPYICQFCFAASQETTASTPWTSVCDFTECDSFEILNDSITTLVAYLKLHFCLCLCNVFGMWSLEFFKEILNSAAPSLELHHYRCLSHAILCGITQHPTPPA